MTLTSIAYVEIYASSGSAGWWISSLEAYGFCRTATLAKANPARDTYVLRRGRACIVVSEVHPGSDAGRHVRQHGDGVADVAVIVDDADEAWARAVAAGASSCLSPAPFFHQEIAQIVPGATAAYRRSFELPVLAVVTSPAGIRHTLCQIPGWAAPDGDGTPEIHHVGLTARPALMQEITEYYSQAFGLTFCPAAARPGGVMTAGRVTISAAAAETGPRGITHLAVTVPDLVQDRQITVQRGTLLPQPADTGCAVLAASAERAALSGPLVPPAPVSLELITRVGPHPRLETRACMTSGVGGPT
jgi:hypothetical protein